MANIDDGFQIALSLQQGLTEAHAWADDPDVSPLVGQWLDVAHDALSNAAVNAGFTPEQIATLFPGANQPKGAHTEDGGTGGTKMPPPSGNGPGG